MHSVRHPTRPLEPALARGLLRVLRDANLSVRDVAVDGGRSVSLVGCRSLDAPAEQGVRYGLLTDEGEEWVLELACAEGELVIAVHAGGETRRRIAVELGRDDAGRITAPRLAARIAAERPDRRAVEHLLRRVVRGVLAG